MNNKIQELIEQATSIKHYDDGEGNVFPLEEFNKEKFAELIVSECSEHIRNRAMRAGGACTIVGEESLWLAKDLEEHFGVE